MKKCVYCHSDISEHGAFCPICGKPQPQQTVYGQTQQTQYQQSNPAPAPQPQQSKNNGAIWGVVGFLAAAVIGLGGWFVYDKLIKEQPSSSQTVATVDKEKAVEKVQTVKKEVAENKEKTEMVRQKSEKQTVSQQPRPIRGAYNMTGAISKYPITMNISITDGEVVGTYYYHSQGSKNKMTVNGYITADHRMVMEEYAPSGLNTGYFDGYFNGTTFSGQFSNYEKDSHLSFSLTAY